MTVRMGRKLCELSASIIDDRLNRDWLECIKTAETPGTHPVSLGLAFAALDVDGRDAFGAQQYGVATTILGAALRLMRVSFMDTQKFCWRRHPPLPPLTRRLRTPASRIWQASPRWSTFWRLCTSRAMSACS